MWLLGSASRADAGQYYLSSSGSASGPLLSLELVCGPEFSSSITTKPESTRLAALRSWC